MVCFWIIIELLIRLLAPFLIYGGNKTWNLSRNWRIESTDTLLKLGKDYFKSTSSHIEYLLGWLYGLFSNNYPATYSFIGIFWSYGLKMWHRIWYEIEGLDQQISYWKLAQIISRVFQVIWNNFKGGFMDCFWIIVQLLIHLLASFWIYGGKISLGIWFEIEGLNQQIS